jgi:hypothetical protein
VRTAGYILTGMRKCRRRAHSPLIIAHSLASDFFGVEELESWFPDFDAFQIWPATARLLYELRALDRPELAGQSSLEHFAHWRNPTTRRITLCSRIEAKRAKWEAKRVKRGGRKPPLSLDRLEFTC